MGAYEPPAWGFRVYLSWRIDTTHDEIDIEPSLRGEPARIPHARRQAHPGFAFNNCFEEDPATYWKHAAAFASSLNSGLCIPS